MIQYFVVCGGCYWFTMYKAVTSVNIPQGTDSVTGVCMLWEDVCT